MIELIHEYGREAVFHRAFDCIDNQDSAAERLIRLGADRILTSGGAANVWMAENSLSIFKINMEKILRFWPEAA